MYSKIDPILNDWLRDKSLHLQTSYRGEEVRSIDYITVKGNKYQIWLTPLRRNIIRISVWDYRKNKVVFEIEEKFLRLSLDKSINIVRSWER